MHSATDSDSVDRTEFAAVSKAATRRKGASHSRTDLFGIEFEMKTYLFL